MGQHGTDRMRWEGQDSAGQHRRLGTRSEAIAVMQEKARGLGHLCSAPEAEGMVVGRQGTPLSQAPEQLQPDRSVS